MAVPVDGGERGLNLGGVRAQETLPAVLVAIDVRDTWFVVFLLMVILIFWVKKWLLGGQDRVRTE